MKKIVFILLALIVQIGTTNAIDDKKVKSKIKDVTVFLQGAQVHRKGNFQIYKGQTRIVFHGMTQNFDKNSIQVKGKGDFIILEVSTNIHYPEPTNQVSTAVPAKILKQIKNIEDSISIVWWDTKLLDKELNAYNQELNVLMASGVFKGLPQSDSIAALIDAMDYMRVKVSELNGLIFELEKEKNDITTTNTNLQTRLNTLRNYSYNAGLNQVAATPVQQIIVTVQCDKTVDGSIDMSYMVWGAGWNPSYDLRADDISSDTKLTYKAKVYQNTGIDWNNVNITLSSVNPNQSNYKPTLAPWYINYYQAIEAVQMIGNYGITNARTNNSVEDMAIIESDESNYDLDIVEASHMNNYTQMTENLTMVEFELEIPYTIESDGKEHLMAIQSVEIPTNYQYYAVPKLDKDAFLIAKITDWESLNLLPAVANIYYDGTYVGQTRINPAIMSDTMELALGRDREIFITRKLAKDQKEEKLLKTDVIKNYTYEISLKNNKSTPLHIIIEDQLPITQNEDIKITLTDAVGADINKKNGTITWNVTLDPKKYKTLEFTYSIKHDKDQQLTMN